jgi:hypothetical protein
MYILPPLFDHFLFPSFRLCFAVVFLVYLFISTLVSQFMCLKSHLTALCRNLRCEKPDSNLLKVVKPYLTRTDFTPSPHKTHFNDRVSVSF